MTTHARIQLKLQRDTGSIFYQDKDDNLAFHIEALRSTNPSPPSAHTNKMTSSSDQSSQASTAVTSANSDHEDERGHASSPAACPGGEESEAATDLIKSFLRQHLLKNGERSRCLIPLMKKDGIEALLIATVALHLRTDGRVVGEEGSVRDDAAAVRSLHKTLGSLVSVLQQRERVLTYLEENPHVVPGFEAAAEGAEK